MLHKEESKRNDAGIRELEKQTANSHNFKSGNKEVAKKDWLVTKNSPIKVMRDIAIQEDQVDPFYVLDVGDLIRKVQDWRRLMPRVDLFYAVKCNDHIAVLETLVGLGTGFDCASKAEIQKVLSVGASPSRIIFAHPCKLNSDIKFVSGIPLPLMTFDSMEELYKVKDIYPKAELVLRIRCDAISANYILGEKFGADVAASRSLLALAIDLQLRVVGVSFHVGSGWQEVAVYHRAIEAARQVFDKAEGLGLKLHLLDIGGGFPGKRCDVIDGFASVINAALEKFFPHEDGLKIIAEPGRYVVTSAFTLATTIMARKMVINNNCSTVMYYINDGVYGSFSCNLAEEEPFSPKILLDKRKKDKEVIVRSKLWGPSCCAMDVVKKEIGLPTLECGDWLYWPDMGAYTLSQTTLFNRYPLPSVHVMVSPEFEHIY